MPGSFHLGSKRLSDQNPITSLTTFSGEPFIQEEVHCISFIPLRTIRAPRSRSQRLMGSSPGNLS